MSSTGNLHLGTQKLGIREFQILPRQQTSCQFYQNVRMAHPESDAYRRPQQGYSNLLAKLLTCRGLVDRIFNNLKIASAILPTLTILTIVPISGQSIYH